MSHRIIATHLGWLLVSHLGQLALDASLFDSYTEAFAALACRQGEQSYLVES